MRLQLYKKLGPFFFSFSFVLATQNRRQNPSEFL